MTSSNALIPIETGLPRELRSKPCSVETCKTAIRMDDLLSKDVVLMVMVDVPTVSLAAPMARDGALMANRVDQKPMDEIVKPNRLKQREKDLKNSIRTKTASCRPTNFPLG